MIDAGPNVEVLTVDNHADGPYVYLRMVRQGSPRAGEVLELLKMNAGNSSGLGIGCINWDGDVYPDQFWRHRVLGNVLNKPFPEIWDDPDNEFLVMLKNKKDHVHGSAAGPAAGSTYAPATSGPGQRPPAATPGPRTRHAT
ncbi:MAG: SPASM domain-containing protein [Desulfosudis oleivorans]|nr:SPASM domain-containing protein [Desulfosudis oleivorans]